MTGARSGVLGRHGVEISTMNDAVARNLDPIAGGTGRFSVLAVDHRAALRRMLEPGQ